MQRFSSIFSKSDIEHIFGHTTLRSSLTQCYLLDVADPVNMLVARDGFVVKGLWGASPVSEELSIPLTDYRQVHVKSTFRMAFRTQRCIILADSYYTWKGSSRKPLRVHFEKEIMFFPAIYFKTKFEDYGFTIISRPARKSLREHSEVEPVVFNREQALKWLDFLPVAEVIKVLHTCLPKPFKTHNVSQKVFVKGFNSKILHESQADQILLF